MKKLSPKQILNDLVAFPSISGRANDDIVLYLERFFVALGFDVVRIMSPDEPKRFNLLCKIGPDKEGGLMLSGHMDVVPTAGQNWQSDPFVLTEKADRLVGRGTADMKGFIASTCAALADFSYQKLKKPLTLLWTYDEEVGCTGSAFAAPLLKNYLSYLPKAALIGEPTDFTVLRMHAGHVTVKVNAQGKGAHSSDPELGISAIRALNQALNGLFALESSLKKETSFAGFFKRPFVTMNIGEIHGGTAVNIVPDQAFAIVGFRPLPDTSVDSIFERMVAACTDSQPNNEAKISLFIEKKSPAMITREGTALENILRPFAKSSGTCAAQYSTDAGNLSEADIECLIYGPGTIDVAHQANEWIYEHDLTTAVDAIRKVLEKWFLLV